MLSMDTLDVVFDACYLNIFSFFVLEHSVAGCLAFQVALTAKLSLLDNRHHTAPDWYVPHVHVLSMY